MAQWLYLHPTFYLSIGAHTAALGQLDASAFFTQLTFSQKHTNALNTTLCNDVAATIPCHDVTNIIYSNNRKIIIYALPYNQI